MQGLLTLPDEVLDELVERVVARLAPPPSSPWLYGADAAAGYLGWSVQRVYKHVHELPHYRPPGSSRLMFRRDELDRWLEGHREGRVRA